MTHAIRVHETGGPEVLRWEEVQVGEPGPGQVRLRHTAVGVNFIDVYYRTGLYAAPGLPFVVGSEGAGIVEAVGPDVPDLKPGDRVAYAGPMGAYATHRLAPADRLVKIPDGVADEAAAAMMLKGMTAQYLLRRTFKVEKGHTILVHAAAGGVGLLLCQWARHLGATVIGTVGSPEKAALAKAHGAHHTILYRQEDFVQKVAEITAGEKCDVVYDSIGKATYPGSLDCIKPLGLYALFGQSSGPIQGFDPGLLASKGSLFMTRPTLFTYVAKRADLLASANELFDVVKSGTVKVEIGSRLPLADARKAHEMLEARETTGSTVLVP